MKLFLYDKFWDSFIKLPKNIQKKTTEFMSKFRNNSKSAAIHLESISSFKDKQLRTARIDKTYRAIIHAPKDGDDYHLLIIDHHDKAMEWAENKVIEWNRQTQTYQVYEMQEKIVTKEVSVKESSQTLLAKISKDKMLKIGVPEKLLDSIRQIGNFDQLQKIEKYIPDDLFERLFSILDGIGIDFIIQEIEDGLIDSTSYEEQQKSSNNRQFFFEVENDEILEEMLSGDFCKWKVFLHPSQRKLVNRNYKFPVKITGGAGTGKTVVALHRAKALADSDTLFDKKPIFFTTYTKSLVQNLINDFKQLGISSSKVYLDNFHKFVITKAKELKIIEDDVRILDFDKNYHEKLWDEFLEEQNTGFSLDFIKAEYTDIILLKNIKTIEVYLKTARIGRTKRLGRKDRIEIWNICEKFKLFKGNYSAFLISEVVNMLSDYYEKQSEKPFTSIIADEIQDFDLNELCLIRNLVKEKDNDLFLVGDPLQKIYAKNTSFSKAGINVRGKRSKRLKLNYRTTEQIKRLAISSIKDISFDDFDGEEESKKGYLSLLKGDNPVYECFKTTQEELDFIVNIINSQTLSENQFNYSDICIASRKKDGIKDIRNRLHREDIPAYNITNDTGNKNGVRLSTFHSLKGLEFKIIILIDVNDRNFPFKPYGFESYTKIEQFEHIKREKSLMYVAMTRAVQFLYLTGIGEKSDSIQI